MSETQSRPKSWAILGRNLRIITGLILLAYVTTHLLNLSLGLHSVALIDQARPFLSGVWTGLIGSIVLLVALVVHFVLALSAIYRRETFRMPAYDMVQLLAGIAVIPLLAPHVLGILATKEILNDASYDVILRVFWLHNPTDGLRQVILIGVVWIHGCVGLFTWLRTKIWAGRLLPWLYPLAVAIPVLALLGYVEGGRQVIFEAHQQQIAAANAAPEEAYSQPETSTTEPEALAPATPARTPAEIIKLSKQLTAWIVNTAVAMLALTLLARYVRIMRWRKTMVEVQYADGQFFIVKSGPTLLDISRMNDMPHANICRGRGRCGTCRVRVLASDSSLPPATALEQATLDRIGEGDDIRLACQLRPVTGRLEVERLVPPDYSLHDTHAPDSETDAVEAT